MIKIYNKLLSSLFDITDDFFLTILLILVINTFLTKLIECILFVRTSNIKGLNNFMLKKENSIKKKKDVFRLHEKFSYHPLYKTIDMLPFIIQLPFLISVYYSILNFHSFENLSFMWIKDISKPDRLLLGINLLPILMFGINLLLIRLSKKSISKIDLFFPFLFLFLLYKSPSSLLIYWIFSLIFSHFAPSFKFSWKIQYTYTLTLVPFYLFKLESIHNLINIFFLFAVILFLENLIKSKKPKQLLIPLIFCTCYTNILDDSIILLMDDFTLNNQTLSSIWRYSYSFTLMVFISIMFIFIKERITKSLFIILSVSTMFFGIAPSSKNRESTLQTKQSIPTKKNDNALILIILDEYASPLELSNYLDEVDMNFFSNYLTENNWLVKNNFYSNETSTTLSIYSLFNYNLIGENILKQKPKNNLYTNFLEKKDNFNSKLLKDLREDSLKIESFGLFDFNYIREDRFLPKWESDNNRVFSNLSSFSTLLGFLDNSEFLYDIFSKTILSRIDAKYKVKKFKESIFDYFNVETINKYDFVWYHFHMPHPPFRFKEEFKFNGKSVDQYVKFWKFTNQKFTALLNEMNLKNNKIILIGDHGFRSSNNINPNNTFGAFYGFKPEEINNIETVQDVGLIIKKNLIH